MRFKIIHIVMALLFSAYANAGALERLFAPKSELWSFWDTSSSWVTPTIDHTIWDRFLQTYVQQGNDGINRLRYANVGEAVQQALQGYIAQQQQIAIRKYTRNEQLAFWINLYNAVTVNVVLQHYPVESIRQINISPGFFAEGPWGKKLLSIERQAISLNDIEHRILRPIWKDARLHYALNCASIGCPNILNKAYTANNLDNMLDKTAQAYINHPRGVRIKDEELIVSSIYSWFQEDFGSSEITVIQHLLKYAKPVLASKLKNRQHIDNDEYDWRLNDAIPVKLDVNTTEEY